MNEPALSELDELQRDGDAMLALVRGVVAGAVLILLGLAVVL